MNEESDRWRHLEDYDVKYCRTEIAMYEEIMAMTGDIRVISDYYGASDQEVQRAKDYAFGSGVSKYEFLPDIDMAKAWLRMARGEGTEIDRVFLQHEILESDLVINQKMAQDSAHKIAESRYNWRALLLRKKKR
jgi:hypothetical protein